MEGIILLTLLVALVAIGVLVAGRRGRVRSVEQNSRRCSSCQTPMSLRRVSLIQSLTLRGVLHRQPFKAWCATRVLRARIGAV
jgi:hypothetical protein